MHGPRDPSDVRDAVKINFASSENFSVKIESSLRNSDVQHFDYLAMQKIEGVIKVLLFSKCKSNTLLILLSRQGLTWFIFFCIYELFYLRLVFYVMIVQIVMRTFRKYLSFSELDKVRFSDIFPHGQ